MIDYKLFVSSGRVKNKILFHHLENLLKGEMFSV